MKSRRTRLPVRLPGVQRGVVLLIALIMLIVLTLGGIALFRQVTTGVLIASNLTFKNAALVAADRGIEAARNWLVSGAADLGAANPAAGYFPSWCNISVNAGGIPDADNNGLEDDCKASPPPSQFDPLTYNWTNSAVATADDGNGNAVRFVIHRLCRIPGTLNHTNAQSIPQECVTAATACAGTDTKTDEAGNAPSQCLYPYFRITSQTTGPKNTVAYTQTIIY